MVMSDLQRGQCQILFHLGLECPNGGGVINELWDDDGKEEEEGILEDN